MPEIVAEVYDGLSPSTLIAELENRRDPQWLAEYNDTGSGSLKLHPTDPIFVSEPSIIDHDNIIRFVLDGVERFAFIIEKPKIPPAPPGEEVDREWEVSGRGVLAVLENAVVYPETAIEGSTVRQRPFDWTAQAYDDSGWDAALQIQRQDVTSGGAVPPWYGFPTEWPDPLAYWIWTQTEATPDWVPAGISYFRKEFTLSATQTYFIFASCDNGFRVWLDGEVVIEDWPGDGGYHWNETRKAEVRLNAGPHIIAVECSNYVNPDGDDTPAGLIISVIENLGGVQGAVLLRTDNTWLCLDYPADVPGMSVGVILRLLLEEAQDRGGLPGVTWSFTDTDDSNGEPWASEPDVALEIGTSYLNVIRTFVEQFIDVDMTPALVLNVYNKGTLGSDLTGSVELLVGEHFEEQQTEGEPTTTNAIVARNALGELTEQVHDGSLATRVRKEAYLEMALAPNIPRAKQMCVEVLVDHSHPVVQIRARLTRNAGPYTDFGLGDVILCPGQNGDAQPTSILTIGVEEDGAGHAIFHAEGAQGEEDAPSS